MWAVVGGGTLKNLSAFFEASSKNRAHNDTFSTCFWVRLPPAERSVCLKTLSTLIVMCCYVAFTTTCMLFTCIHVAVRIIIYMAYV